MNCLKFALSILAIFSLIHAFNASETLSPKNRGVKKKAKEKITEQKTSKVGPQPYSVYDKKLVALEVKVEDILENYQAFYTDTDEFNFKGTVLGYVTPWNNHGYDVARIFGNKFTHISPVWFQVKRQGPKNYKLTGTHDIDNKWISVVRNAGKERHTKIVPRVLFDGWTGGDYKALLESPDEVESLINVLIESCKQYKFDGFVVEMWTRSVESDLLVSLIQEIGSSFIKKNLVFILVSPPGGSFTKEEFDDLYDHVTAFSLMTYDFSNSAHPGPNSPTNWVEPLINSMAPNETRRPKILMGLNFYGRVFSRHNEKPIIGHEYIDILKNGIEDMQYIPSADEHYFSQIDKDGDPHFVFYPTLYSIMKHLELAHKLKVGIAIWELGQGLDYFYDLL